MLHYLRLFKIPRRDGTIRKWLTVITTSTNKQFERKRKMKLGILYVILSESDKCHLKRTFIFYSNSIVGLYLNDVVL